MIGNLLTAVGFFNVLTAKLLAQTIVYTYTCHLVYVQNKFTLVQNTVFAINTIPTRTY